MLHRIKLLLEFNGANFHGWQHQPGQRTIQTELHRALSLVLRQPAIALTASGRTDAGVHALAQVAHFDIECENDDDLPDLDRLCRAVSSILRHEVALLGAEYVPSSFHARFSSKAKVYQYRVIQRSVPLTLDYGRALFVSAPLDIQAMRDFASDLVGKHDFSSFQASGCVAQSPVRQLYSAHLEKIADNITVTFFGDGFLKQMVRNIVGTLIEVGKRRFELCAKELIASKDRKQAGPTAPAHGLYLKQVVY